MPGDKTTRNRYVLVARWPGARERPAPSGPSQSEPPAADPEPASSGPQWAEPSWVSPALPAPELPAPTPPARGARRVDGPSLFGEFEAEIRRALPGAEGERLCALLAGPWAAFVADGAPESRAKLQETLDLVEDVLDAWLLVRPSKRSAEPGAAAP